MNARQTAEALAQLCAGFRYEVDDIAAQVWARELADVDPADGHAAVRALLRHNRFMPTISEFLTASREAFARRQPNVRALPAGRPNEATLEQIRDLIAGAKAKVRATKGDHWHGGPQPCQVCGGMK